LPSPTFQPHVRLHSSMSLTTPAVTEHRLCIRTRRQPLFVDARAAPVRGGAKIPRRLLCLSYWPHRTRLLPRCGQIGDQLADVRDQSISLAGAHYHGHGRRWSWGAGWAIVPGLALWRGAGSRLGDNWGHQTICSKSCGRVRRGVSNADWNIGREDTLAGFCKSGLRKHRDECLVHHPRIR
jgi:hypothetical protein